MEGGEVGDEQQQWECGACTYVNTSAEACAVCEICETPRPSSSEEQQQQQEEEEAAPQEQEQQQQQPQKRPPWACPACTLVNQGKTKYCQVCETRRPKRWGKQRANKGQGAAAADVDTKPPAQKPPAPLPPAEDEDEEEEEEEEEEDDGHLAARERFVTLVLFPQFTEAAGDGGGGGGGGGGLRCLVCGKVHSTVGIMRAHFVKTHLGPFGGDLSAGNAGGMAALRLQADERLALAQAQEEEGVGEEDQAAASSAIKAGPGPAPARKRARKRVGRAHGGDDDASSSDDEGDDGGGADGEDDAGPTTRSGRTLVYNVEAVRRHAVLRETMREMEARKQRRLELLVQRTTALLRRLKGDIAALVGAAASASAAAAADGKAEVAAAAGSMMPKRLQGVMLRDYQVLGVQWMLSLHAHGLNGTLADEMGLGKTLQVLAFLCLLQERTGIWGPHLVVAPLSVLSNWKDELTRVVAGARFHVYHGQREERREAFNAETKKWRELATDAGKEEGGGGGGGGGGDEGPVIVLTTYEMVLKDEATLRLGGSRGLEWEYLVVDEAHCLKNRHGKLLAAMQALRARRRLLLTGTPLQNDLSELFSLLSFVQPSLFKRVHTLQDWFDQPNFEGEQQQQQQKELRTVQLSKEEEDVVIGQLHTLLRPFLLRRTKAQVLASLPAKQERVVRCPLSALQTRLYALLQDGCQAAAAAHKSGAAAPVTRQPLSTANLLMQLRKLCCHPFLLVRDVVEWDELEPVLVPACGKLVVLAGLLARLKTLGRRVLIFSQLTSMLDLLEAFMEIEGHEYLRLDGGTKAEERPGLIEAFNAPGSQVFAFLISTRAGGLGLNLQSADTCIIYDSDWNPQNDIQAQARCHRIGQTSDVLVLRLVSVGPEPGTESVEEGVLAIAGRKLERERRIIEAGEFSFGMDKKEGQEEEAEVDARAELQSLLELQCVTRASRATALATADNNGAKPPPDAAASSPLQLELLDRERLDALAARDETELARLRQLPPPSPSSSSSSNDDARGEATLMEAGGLPTWLAKLEEQMLGLGGSRETEWGIVAPDSKRRRVARFDSLSDAAIYRQRRREGDEEEAEAAAERASLSSSRKGRKKPAAGGGGGGNGASRTPPPLAPAPPDAECVKCLVEGRLEEKVQGWEQEEALVLCASCVNPYHRSCLGAGRGKRCCAFCEAEE